MMEELPEGIDSKFRYVLLVSRRAEQLIQGAPVKVKSRFTKPTRIAMQEIEKGVVNWQLTPFDEPQISDLLSDERL